MAGFESLLSKVVEGCEVKSVMRLREQLVGKL